MKRFRELVLALIGGCAILTMIAYFACIPRYPTDATQIIFTNPDGTACDRPCLFGVRPGQTSYAEAVTTLHAHPFPRDFAVDLRQGILRGPAARVILHRVAGQTLSEIDLVRTAPGSQMAWGPLGNVVAWLSVPDWTSLNSDFTVSYYLTDHLVFHHSHNAVDRIGLDDRLEEVGVFAQLPPVPPGATSWFGFSTASRYLPGAGHVHLRTGIMTDLAPGCTARSMCRTAQ